MDALCYDDLDEFGRDLDDPVAEIEQDIVHMLRESYRTNVDALDRSIGLDDALSSAPDGVTLRHLIETKLCQDPRIDAAQATITAVDATTLQIDLLIQADSVVLNVTLNYDANGNLIRVNQ